MLPDYYKKHRDYAIQLAKMYWVWGIVGTVAASTIWPALVLIVRHRFHEFFLILHHILVIIFLVGFYYHIRYCYNYNWGYGIWAFVAIAIWSIDRLWRLARLAQKGVRTAVVSALLGTDGEYLHIQIQGVRAHGIVYLCFPTLSWMFWENHPFSVASSFAGGHVHSQPDTTSKPSTTNPEKYVSEPKGQQSTPSPTAATAAPASPSADRQQPVSQSTAFIVRSLTGVTARFAVRLAAGVSPRTTVLLDGLHHSSITSGLSDCASLVCIAGGVGVTGVLPVLRSFHTPKRAQLFWVVRKPGLVDGMGPEMSQLSKAINVIVHVGKRTNIAAILSEGLVGDGDRGLTGVVVCGPPGMADKVSELGRSVVTI